jgi:retron-type reverse transcriptase
MDQRLSKAAEEFGFAFTRYADDLTFSANEESSKNISRLLNRVRSIVAHEGFTVNEEKTRVLRKGKQQEVTGVVVNDKLSIDRKTLKRFRATLFQVEKDGPEGKRWGNSSDLISALQGYANFVYMVDKERGTEFKMRVQAIIAKHGWQPPPPKFTPKKKTEEHLKQEASDTNSDSKKNGKKWWKLW